MSRPRIVIAALILLAMLVAVLVWQKDNTPRQLSGTTGDEITSLMPFSDDWNLTDSEDAIVILVFVPNEVTEAQLAIFKEVSSQYGENIKFASLNLTRVHPSYSNTVYVDLFDVSEIPTYIIRRKGESTFHKASGPLSKDEIISFVDSSLKTSQPNH